MKHALLPLLLTGTLILAACSAAAPASAKTAPESGSVSTESAPSSANDPSASVGLIRSDGQGNVTVEVTPLNLDASGDTLEFDIIMDTHSVDLSMDLATLSTLTTDTGITVQATLWDAPRGGHHVEGKLIFPAVKDGKSILEGASKLALTINNVDASSRLFEWDLE